MIHINTKNEHIKKKNVERKHCLNLQWPEDEKRGLKSKELAL